MYAVQNHGEAPPLLGGAFCLLGREPHCHLFLSSLEFICYLQAQMKEGRFKIGREGSYLSTISIVEVRQLGPGSEAQVTTLS